MSRFQRIVVRSLHFPGPSPISVSKETYISVERDLYLVLVRRSSVRSVFEEQFHDIAMSVICCYMQGSPLVPFLPSIEVTAIVTNQTLHNCRAAHASRRMEKAESQGPVSS